jgi:hypothetical protein
MHYKIQRPMTLFFLPTVPRETILAADRSLRLVDQRTTGSNATLHDDDLSLARMIEANHDYMRTAYLHLSIPE